MAIFSTREFAATNTGSVLAYLLNLLHIKPSARHFILLHALIRKAAHFTAYGILSGLFFRAWRGARDSWRVAWALLPLLVCLVTSSSDEIHQHFTPGRTGAVKDVELDMTGAVFAQLAIVAGTSRKKRLRP